MSVVRRLVLTVAVLGLAAAPMVSSAADANVDPRAGAAVRAAAIDYDTGLRNAVALKATPSGKGFVVLARNGTVTSFGDAPKLGSSTSATPVTLAVTRSGQGYWVFDTKGCVEYFGDAARFAGTVCATPLNGPILDAATTPTGDGYWLVASDGGIFAFGGATFAGSMGGATLNRPVVGMAPAPDGRGYWEVAADGGIFAFGVPFLGSMGGAALNRPVVGMVASGAGYLMVSADGGVFNFGNPFFGSLGSTPPADPVVSIAPSFTAGGAPNGYWMLDAGGIVHGFGDAWMPNGSTGPTTTTPVGSPTTQPAPSFGAGVKRVGSQIAPGTYHTATAAAGCVWQRLSGTNGSQGEVLATSFGSGFRVVSVLATDVAFSSEDCGTWIQDTVATVASGGPIPGTGVFRVGIDIEPGTWIASDTTDCSWSRLSNFTGVNAVIQNQVGSGTRTVTVLPTDAGLDVSGCTPFTR